MSINLVMLDEKDIIAVDARISIRTSRANTARYGHMAIHPYPPELETTWQLPDGTDVSVRPIRPEDAEIEQDFVKNLSAESKYFRFMQSMDQLTPMMLARFTQIDYDREMGLILTEPGRPGQTEIFGVANLIADPDNRSAEYAIVVRHDMVGLGLGIVLMRRIIDYARNRGIKEMFGDVLQENRPMLKLCKVLGFSQSRVPDDPGVTRDLDVPDDLESGDDLP